MIINYFKKLIKINDDKNDSIIIVNEKPDEQINWYRISVNEICSEEFIERHKNEVHWVGISMGQKLSEAFIEKFKDKVDWNNISAYQKLSESFMEKYKDKVNWNYISEYQTLSEEFIEKFKDKVDWDNISINQKLSEKFIEKFKYQVHVDLIPNKVDNRTLEEKLENMKGYARAYNLKIQGDYIYANRQHDQWDRGTYNKTIFYDKPGIYRDWKCDLDENVQCSYGLGISSKGNVLVRVHMKDWGIWVRHTHQARAWAFELLN